jgi:hypothetical protein
MALNNKQRRYFSKLMADSYLAAFPSDIVARLNFIGTLRSPDSNIWQFRMCFAGEEHCVEATFCPSEPHVKLEFTLDHRNTKKLEGLDCTRNAAKLAHKDADR